MTPYHNNKEVRAQIDEALKASVINYSKVGTGQLPEKVNSLTLPEQKQWARRREVELLESVEHLDPDYVGDLLEKMGEVG